MKKSIVISIIITLVCVNVSFAQPSEIRIKQIQDLTRVLEDVNLAIKTVMSGKYDEENIKKSLLFDNSILHSIDKQIDFAYKENTTNLKVREDITIGAILSLLALAINGILVYMEDPSLNEQFLFESITSYNEAKSILSMFKTYIRKQE